MARYFFDVQAPNRRVRDDLGLDLQDEVEAGHEAALIVWQLLSDVTAQGCIGNVSVTIRTETGARVHETSTSPADD